uniref:50S ribosomal protein L21, chloroplastic n=1 Tax=Sporolithon durum TaxID=48970 RepID=A0A141SD09_9FLOR|nr:ribosomal protein L21 [Sporolithon durum]AMK96177.1 ribosomal protein L21 [Sporolithon durum]
MTYAIIEISGRQLWVTSGSFYDVYKIQGQPGDIIMLNKILLVSRDNNTEIGYPCIENFKIKAKILKHLKSRKITIFKMKPKKNSKSKKGHRQELTRLLIQEI